MRCIAVHFLMKIEICKHKLIRPAKEKVLATMNGTKQGGIADAALTNNGYRLRFSCIDSAEYRSQFPASTKESAIIFDVSSVQVWIDSSNHESALLLSSSVHCQIERSGAIHIRNKSTRNRYEVNGPLSSQSWWQS